jgi:hypothetical protein
MNILDSWKVCRVAIAEAGRRVWIFVTAGCSLPSAGLRQVVG